MDRRRVVWAAASAGLAALLPGCATPPPEPEAKRSTELAYPPPPDEPRFFFERTIRSSADVMPDEEGGDLRRLVTGETTRGEPLSKPYAIAVTRGRIYVSDTVSRYVLMFDVPAGKHYRIGDEDGHGQLAKPIGLDVDAAGRLYVADISMKCIVVYDADRKFLRRIGDEEGHGQLAKPIGLDVDAAGRLYVADISMKCIVVYDADRKFLRRIGGEKWFSRVSSVTVDPSGKRVYAVDIGGVTSDQHRVRVFDGNTGAHLYDIGSRGSGPGQFNLPRDLAIGLDGRLYVVDGGNFRVVVFDADGRYRSSFGSIGKQYGQFARPKEIAADRDGNIYVVDAAFGNFQIFNPDGELLLFVGDRSERDGPGKYMLPSGIAVDEDGRVYMVDQWFRKVDVYRPVALKANAGHLARRPVIPEAGKAASK